MAYRWKPSKAKAREFAKTMSEIDSFCREHGIIASRTNDSYYFTLNGTNYRVSNHSVERSNEKAFDDFGNQLRELYHAEGRKRDTIYIHASKTRLIEIYNNLANGLVLDGKGNVKA